MVENWKVIPGFPRYEASDLGRVRSKNGVLRPAITRKGYHRYTLWMLGGRKNKVGHQLVLEAFVGPRPVGFVGAHEDGIPTNNALTNLSWKTNQANRDDMIRHGTQPRGAKNGMYTKPERRPFRERNGGNCKLSTADVERILTMRASGMTCIKIAKQFGVTESGISRIIRCALKIGEK